MTFTKKELSEYMRKLGSKGGSVESEKKRAAAQANIAKATKERLAKRKKTKHK